MPYLFVCVCVLGVCVCVCGGVVDRRVQEMAHASKLHAVPVFVLQRKG